MKRFLISISVLFCVFVLQGQDIHFTQFNAQPLILNPAMTGLNGCDYRAGVNFRSQWSSVAAGNTYRTISAFGDMALGKSTNYSNFAGMGLSFYSDQAGDLNYSTNRVDLSAAYHIILGRGKSSFSLGLQGGFIHSGLDESKGLFEFDPVTGEHIETSVESFDRDPLYYGDAALGMLYSVSPKKRSNYFFGLALHHVNTPNISRFGNKDADERLYMKFTFHGGAQIPLSRQLSLLPNYMVLAQGGHFEANIGAYVKYTFSNLPNAKDGIHFGAMYRVKDAFILATRADISNFSIHFSYDINVSKLSPASRLNGGPEIALVYTGCLKKKNNSARYCPVY